MPAEILPVIVARWFEKGASYAYNQQVDSNLLTLIINSLSPISRKNVDHAFKHYLPDGRMLLGRRAEDLSILDPAAVGRHPYVVRIAVCPAELNPTTQTEIMRQLDNLSIPTRQGLMPGLDVRILSPSKPPIVPVRSKLGNQAWVVWIVVIVAIIADFAQIKLNLMDGTAALITRSGLLIGLAYFVTTTSIKLLPGSARTPLNLVEWEWYSDADPPPSDMIRVKGDALIFTPDGRRYQPREMEPLQSIGVRRLPGTEVNYRYAHSDATSAVLLGEETIEYSATKKNVTFFRIYSYEGGCWRLNFAQWSLLGDL